MKIILVNIFFYPDTFGGATTVVEENAKILTNMGHKVIVISLCSRPELAQNQILKTSHKGIVNLQINSNPLNRKEKYIGHKKTTHIIANLISDIIPDVLHVHCIQEIGISFLKEIENFSNLYKTKKILSTHDYWWLYENMFLLGKDSKFTTNTNLKKSTNLLLDDFHIERSKKLNNALKTFDYISTPSDYSTAIHKLNFPAFDFFTLSNGVNLSNSNCIKKDKSKTVYGFMGGPGDIKGFDIIIEATKNASLNNTEIILVKAHVSWYEGIDLPKIFKVIDRFRQDELDTFYKKIDILLFPSQWGETFGLAIREALNRKKWVITTNNGAQEEPITENVNGNIIDIGKKSVASLISLFEEYDKNIPVSNSSYNHSYEDQVNQALNFYDK